MSLNNALNVSGVYLEVRAGDTGRDLFEERLLDPDELRRLDHVQDLFNLPQEHHLNTKNTPTHAFCFFVSTYENNGYLRNRCIT